MSLIRVSRLIKLTSSLVVFALVLYLIAQQSQFLECISDSLNGIRYLVVVKDLPFKRGDIVSIQGHEVKYVKTRLLSKRVIGLPGDRITITSFKNGGQAISVQNGSNPPILLPLLNTTQEGFPLTASKDAIVPEAKVFVAGDHPRSFDSRYAEFGLVPMGKIWGRSIWQW